MQQLIFKFDGFYDHWVKLMENFLRSKEMWNLVDDGVVVGPQNREPTDEEAKTVAEQQLKDKKVKNYLYQVIVREIMETILMMTPQSIYGTQWSKGSKVQLE